MTVPRLQTQPGAAVPQDLGRDDGVTAGDVRCLLPGPWLGTAGRQDPWTDVSPGPLCPEQWPCPPPKPVLRGLGLGTERYTGWLF